MGATSITSRSTLVDIVAPPTTLPATMTAAAADQAPPMVHRRECPFTMISFPCRVGLNPKVRRSDPGTSGARVPASRTGLCHSAGRHPDVRVHLAAPRREAEEMNEGLKIVSYGLR